MSRYIQQVRLFLFTILLFALHTQVSASEIPWTTDYKEAISRSKKELKPVFLYFTGSDWCGWCIKMDKEILTSDEFIDPVKDKFIFVKIDFPIYSTLNEKLVNQNDMLKDKYDIRGFPTVVILDPQQKQIAVLNYNANGPKAFANTLLKLLNEQHEFHKELKDLDKKSATDLQKLYEQATRLGKVEQKKEILQAGLTCDDSLFFLKEQYHQLLQDGKIANLSTQEVRAKLLAKDPYNKKHTHYDVALLDFEALAKNLKDQKSADSAVKPLQAYLDRFGKKDLEYAWKIELTISQVYASKNQQDKALAYAKASHSHAPEKHKTDLSKAIISLEQSSNMIGDASED